MCCAGPQVGPSPAHRCMNLNGNGPMPRTAHRAFRSHIRTRSFFVIKPSLNLCCHCSENFVVVVPRGHPLSGSNRNCSLLIAWITVYTIVVVLRTPTTPNMPVGVGAVVHGAMSAPAWIHPAPVHCGFKHHGRHHPVSVYTSMVNSSE